MVQRHALEAWDEGGDFRERILAEPVVGALLSKEEIERAFSLEEALRHVDAIFARTLAREGEDS
jgi:adenylosuccinate lyase